jgi:DNA repair exonuclease SbcCD ATPase subunit
VRPLDEKQLGPFLNKIEEYRGQAYVVTPLQEALESQDLKVISERFEEFERDVRSLEVLKEALMDLDTIGFEDEVRTIDAKLKDVTKIVEIEDDILKLQLKIERRKKAERRREEEERRERSTFIRRMEEWRALGYKVSRLENLLDSDIGTLEIGFRDFERDINEIGKIRSVLETLWGHGFDEDLEALNKRLMDPDHVFENEEDLLRIKLRIDRLAKKKVVREEAEKDMRKRYKETLDEWTSKGFKVDHLEAVLEEDIDNIAERFEKARNDIGRLRVLTEELEELDTEGYEQEVENINDLLMDLGNVQGAEDAILDLQLKIERKRKEERRKKEIEDRMREELRNKIVNRRAEGFVTDYLYSMLEGDIEILKRAVEDFEAAARKMSDLEDELDAMDTAGYEADVEAIRAKCRDVRKTEEVEDSILSLLVRSRRERREKMRTAEIKRTIEEWKETGYNVEDVEALLEKADLKTIEREFVTYKIGVHTLKELEKDLDGLDAEGFKDEVASIREQMTDINNIAQVEEAIFDLHRRIEERLEEDRTRKIKENKEKHQYVEKLSEWVSEGFREGIIERLEQVISKDKDMETVRTAFKTFESEVARVKELREVLETLEAPGFEGEIQDLQQRLTNIDEVESVEADMMALLNKIEKRHEEEQKRQLEAERKKSEFGKQLEEWAEEGFDVEKLRESLEKEDLVNLRRSFVVYRIRIQKIRDLMRQLEAIDDKKFGQDKIFILPLLRDVNNIEKAEAEMNALRQKVEKEREEAGKRGEFRSKMEEWQEMGYNVDRLVRALSRDDTDFISKEFLVFKIRLQKLEDLREELNVIALSAKDFAEEVETIRELLRDVDKISEIRERISELKAKIDEKRAEEKRLEEEERTLREQLGTNLTQWATQGYNVEELEEVFDDPLDVVQAAFEEFERNITRINRIREDLEKIDTAGFEGDVALIHTKLTDVRRLVEAEEDLEVLREKVSRAKLVGRQLQDGEERMRKELEEKISLWKEQGYDVSSLEALLDKDLAELRKAFVVFRIRVARLKELEEELKTMDPTGFEEEFQVLRSLTKDVERIQDVSNTIADLHLAIKQRRAEERRRKEVERKERETFAAKLVQWISAGYSVVPLESVISGDLGVIRKRFAEFENDVQRLKALEPELEKLEMEGHAREAQELRTMIMDVERVDDIIGRISAIRGKALEIVTEGPPIEVKKDTEEDQGTKMSFSRLTAIRDRLGALRFDDRGKERKVDEDQKDDEEPEAEAEKGQIDEEREPSEKEGEDDHGPDKGEVGAKKVKKVKKKKKKKIKKKKVKKS